jgi:cyclopropane-fatty-acyl-phospholipid synthase
MWLLDKILCQVIQQGRFQLTDYNGREYEYGDPAAAPIRVRLTDKGAALHIARQLDVGAGEAYMHGRLVVLPPHDIRDMVLLFMANANRMRGSMKPKSPLRHALNVAGAKLDQFNVRSRASRNARHHYDLTRQFYELFLDEDRQYTMAYYRDPANSLERAQLDKKALIAAKLRLEPGKSGHMRVLDIGCGWGGFALYLNQHYGCEVLGVSLAPDQVRFAQERAEQMGVADQVKFELIDYRDVEGQFDRITSVGMVEHVGKPHLLEYFTKTSALLKDDGIMLTHTIGRSRGPGMTDKWTRKYIFPGGFIPALSEFAIAHEQGGLEISDVEVLRYHYAHTLAEWYRRAKIHETEITALYSAELFRMWQYYLVGAEQSFLSGVMVNYHIQSVKQRGAVPMTRDYIEQEAARLRAIDREPAWHLDPAFREAAE